MRRSSALILSFTLALLSLSAFLSIITVPAQAELQSETAKVTETFAPRTAPDPLRLSNPTYAPHLPDNSIANSSIARENSLNAPRHSLDFPEGITAVPPPTDNLPVEWWRQRATQQTDTPQAPIFHMPFPNPTPYEPLGQRETTYNGGRLATYVPPNSTPLLNAPLAPTALYTITVQPLHRATGYPAAYSSAFTFTNTGSATVNYYLEFYWLNGQHDGSDGPFTLNPGESIEYNMDMAAIGDTTFVGYVEITGDEPVTGQITTPNYGIIQGFVFEDDGVTPASIYGIGSRTPYPNQQQYGNTYVLNDGRFYLGGLLDDNYTLSVNAPYPWADQWYDGQTNENDAQRLPIVNAGTVSVTVILQPGGRITGTVYAADGVTPLPNINVDIEQGGAGTCTDENGRYFIDGLPYGSYIIIAGGNWNWCLNQESPYTTEYYLEASNSNDATPIDLTTGHDDIPDINFTLELGGIITGQVRDNATGLPITDINVHASEYDTGNY